MLGDFALYLCGKRNLRDLGKSVAAQAPSGPGCSGFSAFNSRLWPVRRGHRRLKLDHTICPTRAVTDSLDNSKVVLRKELPESTKECLTIHWLIVYPQEWTERSRKTWMEKLLRCSRCHR